MTDYSCRYKAGKKTFHTIRYMAYCRKYSYPTPKSDVPSENYYNYNTLIY